MKWTMWMSKSGWAGIVAALAIGSAGMGCDNGSTAAPSAVVITRGQLAERLQSGPVRIEVKLAADGTVSEVHIDQEGPGHEAQLAGRVLTFDAAAGTLEIEFLGTVDFSGAGRFRTEQESREDKAVWVAAVEAALAGGGDVWLDARGSFGAGAFVASELRWEDKVERKVEADIDASAYDEAAGTLTIGSRTFQVSAASFFEGSDDNGGDDVNDDNGGDDANDDSGTDDSGDDANDDHGNDGAEAGDDHGNDGAEAGDDHGNDGAEAGDDHGNDGAEAGDDNGADGAEAGDDNGADGAEAGDDNGTDGAEAGDDSGTDGAEAGDDSGHGGHGQDG
jgi:hypothetical protein